MFWKILSTRSGHFGNFENFGNFGNFANPESEGIPKFPKFWILFFTSQVTLLCSVAAPPSYMHMCSIIPLFRGHPRALSRQSPHRTRTITILGANMTSQSGEASLSKYTPAYTNVHKYTYHFLNYKYINSFMHSSVSISCNQE